MSVQQLLDGVEPPELRQKRQEGNRERHPKYDLRGATIHGFAPETTSSPLVSGQTVQDNQVIGNQNTVPQQQKLTQKTLWSMFVDFLSIGQGTEFLIRIVVPVVGVLAGLGIYLYSQLKPPTPSLQPTQETINQPEPTPRKGPEKEIEPSKKQS